MGRLSNCKEKIREHIGKNFGEIESDAINAVAPPLLTFVCGAMPGEIQKKLTEKYAVVREACYFGAGEEGEIAAESEGEDCAGRMAPTSRAEKIFDCLEGSLDKLFEFASEKYARLRASELSTTFEGALGIMLLSGGVPAGIPFTADAATRVCLMYRHKEPVGSLVLELPYRAAKAIYKNCFADAGKESERELTGGRLEQYSASVNPK